MTRRSLLARVHMAKKSLGLTEGTYRAVLERVTGHRSAADCTDPELARAVTEFRRLGWRPKPQRTSSSGAASRKSQLSKARALWRTLWCLGETDSDGDEALSAYAARMTRSAQQPDGIQRLQWLDAKGWERVIRGLRGWCKRIGYETTDRDVARINACRRRLGLSNATAVHCAKIRLVELLVARAAGIDATRDVLAYKTVAEHAGNDDPRPERLSADSADAAARKLRGVCQ